MHPVLIDFGFFKLHTYGLMMAIAFMVGMQLAVREARRIDLSKKRDFDQFILDLCFWILISALIGSRIVFIMVNWEQDYSNDPLKMFRVWEGGLHQKETQFSPHCRYPHTDGRPRSVFWSPGLFCSRVLLGKTGERKLFCRRAVSGQQFSPQQHEIRRQN